MNEKWLPPVAPTKDSLIAGIKAQFVEQTGIEHLDLSFLHRIPMDGLLVLAFAMGFQHEASREELERQSQWRLQQFEQAEARQEEEQRQRAETVGSIQARTTDAVLDVVAESLTAATYDEIMAYAKARDLDGHALVVRVVKMIEGNKKDEGEAGDNDPA